jgi:ribosomal protein S18 acetylase RimI-like enzyme
MGTEMVEHTISAPDYTVRQLQISDALNLAAFYNRLSKESKRTFRPIGPITVPEKCAEIAKENNTHKFDLIAIYGGEIIGWAFLWDLKTATPTLGLAVADNYHNLGVGKMLLRRVLVWAKNQAINKIHLTVVQDNDVAWKLYAKHGFVKTGSFTGDDGQLYFKMVATL